MGKEYKICSKTVMDTSDKYIKFDSNNISNHYWEFQNQIKLNWNKSIKNESYSEIEKTIDKIKKSGTGKTQSKSYK